MPLGYLVAIAGGGDEDEQTLAITAGLARRHAAVAEVMPAHPDAAMDMIDLGTSLGARLSVEVLDKLEASERLIQQLIEARARAVAEASGITFGAGSSGPCLQVLTPGLRPMLDLAGHLALADLVVFGQPYLDRGDRRIDVLSQVLIEGRAPVLVARGSADRLTGVAAIAWDGSWQAGRAVRAALPLLLHARKIVIVQQTSGLDTPGGGSDPARLGRCLEAHGLSPAEIVFAGSGEEGEVLLAAAQSVDAELFVAGAWGHSRLREFVFGGATRSFLRDADGPCLLLAH